MSHDNLAEVLGHAPRECWVALTDDQSRVVGRGETIAEALAEAQKNGVKDPIVTWLPKVLLPTVYGGRASC